MSKTLPPNAHTADDFYLGENEHMPIKTQTLMWYLKQTHKRMLESNMNVIDINTFGTLIKRLEADQERKISHIRKALHG